MSNLGGFTDAQTWQAAGCAAAFLGAYMADRYTTTVGLAHGLVEGNPLMKWLNSKISFSLAAFLVGGAILIGGAAMTNISVYAADAFWGIIAVGEAVTAILNYKKLKAAKISLL
jgi:hypothetical protein